MYKYSPHYKYSFLMMISKHTKTGQIHCQLYKSQRKNSKRKEAIDFDKVSLIGNRLLYPTKNITKKGVTRYDSYKAQKWLKQAAKEGKTQDKTPLHLNENVLSLQSFSLKQIASHKNQE